LFYVFWSLLARYDALLLCFLALLIRFLLLLTRFLALQACFVVQMRRGWALQTRVVV
jgi:hypothetical protein